MSKASRYEKGRSHIGLLNLALVILLSLGYSQPALMQTPDGPEDPPIAPNVMQALDAQGTARVVILLNAPDSQIRSLQAKNQALAQTQVRLLASVTARDFQLIHRYQTVSGLVGMVTSQGLAQLSRSPDIRAVALDMPVYPATLESATLIRADQVWNDLGITGKGVRIAVIDSGIDTKHPDLSEDILAQRCFTHGACPPSENNEGFYAQDQHGHGTRIAGIITGEGRESPKGIAPDAEIVAVQVMDQKGMGWASDVVAGIDWVIANQGRHNVKIINLSLGGGMYQGVCDTVDANTILYADALAAAYNAGITVFAASGNQGQRGGMIAPACISHAISVGCTYDANLGSRNWGVCTDVSTDVDQIACFSNSDATLDLLAPGAWTETTALGGGKNGDAGTSTATAHVSAVAALMLQANPNLTPREIKQILKETGIAITDARNDRITPRIDALAAVRRAAPDAFPETISGKVTLQGRRDHGGTILALSDATCSANLYMPTEATITTTTDAQGNFELTLSPEYNPACLYVTHPGYLQGQATLPAESGRTLKLLAGDIIQDNLINIFDLVRVASKMGSSAVEADLNTDGQVDILDLTLVAGNYNQRGPLTNWE
jgi:subtilisin family serine protease